jgi:hypothetical protein
MKRFLYWLLGWTIPTPPPPSIVIKPRLPQRPFTPKIRKCVQMDKFMYTREQAVINRDKLRGKNLRIYMCEYCNTWHLTHRKFKNF